MSDELFNQLKEMLGVSRDLFDEGLALHRESIVVDMLCFDPKIYTDRVRAKAEELISRGLDYITIRSELEKVLQEELRSNGEARRLYMEAWDRAGVTVGSITLSSTNFQSAISSIAMVNERLDLFQDRLVKVTRAEHIRRAKEEGKHGIIMNFQNTTAIGGGVDVDAEMENLRLFYRLGVRVIQLTYNLRNFVGDGCTERYQSGLTYYGVRLVEEMNKLGMLVDLSHCGHQTTMDAIEVSKKPCAFTHTCCKTLYPHPRCKTDEEIKALVEKGGVVGILGVKYFIAKNGTLVDMLNHVDKAVELVGVDNVGISTDHWHIHNYPEKLTEVDNRDFQEGYMRGKRFWYGFRPEHGIDHRYYPPREPDPLAWVNWPAITIGLLSRGYSKNDVKKIIGENWIRLLEKVIG